MVEFVAVVEKEDDLFVAHCMKLGIASQGKTVEKSLANLKEACELYLKHADEKELTAFQKKKEPILAKIKI